VLLVEDDRELREALREALEAEGYKVFSAYDGASALKLLAGVRTPDLVVLDLKMPGMNGREFLRVFKASAAWSEIPVIAISAVAPAPPGVSEFLPKPVELPRLLAAIRRYCNRALGGVAPGEGWAR
jgi:CheY-like chemotaxis protein